MKQYKYLIEEVLNNGYNSEDRTGTGTKSVFGTQVKFDLSKGFPLLTLKNTFWKGIVIELLWMLRGETNNHFLVKNGVHIWDDWATTDGELGPVYGAQWRKFPKKCDSSVDQIKELIEGIKTNPYSRRHIVSAWNPGQINEMALPPCHAFFQFYVRDGKLSCKLTQRSADLFLGVPFNIASYALLTHLIANECGLEVGEFIHSFGDLHIYNNHIEQCEEMLNRTEFDLPKIEINIPQGELLDFIDSSVGHLNWEEIQGFIELKGYKSHGTLKGAISV